MLCAQLDCAKGPVLMVVLLLGLSGHFSAAKSRGVSNCGTEGWLFVLRWALLAGKSRSTAGKMPVPGLSSWQINNSFAIFFF